MSKNSLTVTTAVLLILAALAILAGRRFTQGPNRGRPRGASSWQVTMTASGELPPDQASVLTPRPPDFRHQHIFDEQLKSEGVSPPHGKKNHKPQLVWRRSSLGGPQPFQLSYAFHCILGMRRANSGMVRRTHEIDAAPRDGALLKPSSRIESQNELIGQIARELVKPNLPAEEKVQALFEYVSGLENDPRRGYRTALECCQDGGGSSNGKSCLLIALCRNQGIAARMVCGLILDQEPAPSLHQWVEAWISNRWLPMCPTYHYFGVRRLPRNFLVLHVGDDYPFHRRGIGFEYRFQVKELRNLFAGNPDQEPSAVQVFWSQVSLYNLRPGEQTVVKFLLLLPLAALIVSIYRTLIGVPTYGTFSPALVGLAFLDLKALPFGLGIFVLTVLVGWGLRRLLDRYHLLLVPRTSVLLTLIVVFLIGVMMIANHLGVSTTQYISLFPLVILTHLVERFWMVESEDGTTASFKTLLGTLVVAVTVSVALSPAVVTRWMFQYPETLGIVIAVQMLIGRYTGYRISELYRFRDLVKDLHLPEKAPAPQTKGPDLKLTEKP